MRKYIISFSSFLIILVLVTFSTVYALCEKDEKSELKSLIKLNLEIHNSFEYGKGLPGYPTLEETIKFGNGHCGLYTTYFAEKAIKMGFNPIVVDLTSGIKNEDELFHSVVEIKLGKNYYIFDPTLGIYYKHNINDLVTSPFLANQKVGTVTNENLEIYSKPIFWSNVFDLNILHNQDYYQQDYIHSNEFEVISKNLFYKSPNDLYASFDGKVFDNYTASIEGDVPVSFTIKFKNPITVNRIYLSWFDFQNFPTEFKVYDNNGNELVSRANYQNNVGYLNEWLRNSVMTDSLTFSFTKFKGQQRLLLRKLSIY